MLNSAAIFSITGNNEVDLEDEAQVEASRRVPHASSWTIHGTGHHLQGKREPICMHEDLASQFLKKHLSLTQQTAGRLDRGEDRHHAQL